MVAIAIFVRYWGCGPFLVTGGDAEVLVEQAISKLGRLDILVNNAAYQITREGICSIPDGEWEHTFRTNVYCPQ